MQLQFVIFLLFWSKFVIAWTGVACLIIMALTGWGIRLYRRSNNHQQQQQQAQPVTGVEDETQLSQDRATDAEEPHESTTFPDPVETEKKATAEREKSRRAGTRHQKKPDKDKENRLKAADEQLLERVTDICRQNISNPEIKVDDIAREVGFSRVHLHRRMKELTGLAPHDFLRNLRMQQAAHMLTADGMSVTEVMRATGFQNAASFSTTFKHIYGLSPRQYQQQHQNP